MSCDPVRAAEKHGNRYDGAFAFLNELYALRHTPFQELIPDNSRYGIIALLPPGSGCLDPGTRVVAQEELLSPGRASELFSEAFPRRFDGEAFMWECDGTVIVTHSRENEDVRQSFAMRLERGPVSALGGVVAVHDCLVGKIAEDGRSAWFHANFGFDTHATRGGPSPNPDRHLELFLACAS